MLGAHKTDDPSKATAMPVVARQVAGAMIHRRSCWTGCRRLYRPGVVAVAQNKPIATGSSDSSASMTNDIRTVEEVLGHEDVKTTTICTNVLNRGPSGVRKPVDGLQEGGSYADPHNMPKQMLGRSASH